MNVNLFITPVAGGIIGYFTNWLAIKMLFRPHEAVYLNKYKVPFTPGLIPKEKARIASTLGDTVGNYLLTQEVILEGFSNYAVVSSLESIMEKILNSLKNSNLTFEEALIKTKGFSKSEDIDEMVISVFEKFKENLLNENVKEDISNAIYIKVSNILENDIKELNYEKNLDKIENFILKNKENISNNSIVNIILVKIVWTFLISLKEDERNLGEIFSYSSIEELKDYISIKVPIVVNSLINLTENQEIENLLKEKINIMVQSFTGPFMSMFINPDDIYASILENLTTYFNNPANSPEIEKCVGIAIEKALEISVGEGASLLTSELRENSINRSVSFLMKELFSEKSISFVFESLKLTFKNSEDITLSHFFTSMDKGYDEKIRTIIDVFVKTILSESTLNNICNFSVKKILCFKSKELGSFFKKINEKRLSAIKDSFFTFYRIFIAKAAPKILEAFSIPKIVEERINSFSTAYTEELIISIVNKELKAITAVGGVLGFIIGLIPAFLNFI